MLYTVNTNPQLLATNQIISVGTTVKRSGCTVKQNGDSISIDGAGLYRIGGAITCKPTASGLLSATVYRDGQPLAGTTFSANAATGNLVTIPILAVIKLKGCCCDEPTIISIVFSGVAGTVEQIVTEVYPV